MYHISNCHVVSDNLLLPFFDNRNMCKDKDEMFKHGSTEMLMIPSFALMVMLMTKASKMVVMRMTMTMIPSFPLSQDCKD